MADQIEMFPGPLSDLKTAKLRREEGIAAARAAQSAKWRASYRKLARQFMRDMAPGETFMGERLRTYALAQGLGQPRSSNAWSAMAGSLIREWLRDGVISEAGIAQATGVKSHAHRYVQYRVEGGGNV